MTNTELKKYFAVLLHKAANGLNARAIAEAAELKKIFQDVYEDSTPAYFDLQPTHDAPVIDNPPHYAKGGIECYEAIQACFNDDEYRGFLRGNIIKYILRLNDKATPIENLKVD